MEMRLDILLYLSLSPDSSYIYLLLLLLEGVVNIYINTARIID